MRRRARIFTAVAVLLALAPTLAAQTIVRVLTYNIHRDVGGNNSNTGSQPQLAKVVNYLKPDIWTINELGGNDATFSATTAHNALVSFIHDQLTIFGANAQENTNYFIYISTIDDSYTTVAIVSRYPFASTHTYSDAGNGFSALRGLALASVQVPGPTRLDIFTAHLKALSTTNDAEKRQTETDVDRNNIMSWIGVNGADAIAVTGDWNETEDAGETTNWSNHSIGDILPNPNEPYQPITTMRSAGLTDPSPASIAGNHDTIDSTTPDARFDYAMYAKLAFLNGEVFDTKQYTAAQLAALNAANGTNFVASDSANASDHLPVLALFRVGFAPIITKTAREGGNLAVTYIKVVAANVTYTVESSTNLSSWTTAQPSNQIIAEGNGTQTIKASVPAPTRLFLRVRANIGP